MKMDEKMLEDIIGHIMDMTLPDFDIGEAVISNPEIVDGENETYKMNIEITLKRKKEVTESNKVDVMFFPNGNTAVFKNGKQVAELQKPWILAFAGFLAQNGVDIENSTFELSGRKIELYKTDEGYNWRFV